MPLSSSIMFSFSMMFLLNWNVSGMIIPDMRGKCKENIGEGKGCFADDDAHTNVGGGSLTFPYRIR